MRAEERENVRYSTADYCPVNLEEEVMFSLFDDAVKQWKRPPQKIKVLDVGCGSGGTTEELHHRGFIVRGLDFSDTAVQKAKSKGIDAVQCDLDEGIPENSNTYDVVWAGDILEHVFDPIGVIKEMSRVLKPDGIVLVSIPSDVGIVSRIKMLFGISHQEQMYKTSGYYKHHTFFTPGLIRFMLSKGNLSITDFKRILILGQRHLLMPPVPAAFFNEMIIRARKPANAKRRTKK